MFDVLKKNLYWGALFWCGLAFSNEPLPSQIVMTADLDGQVVVVHLQNQESYVATVKVFPGKLSSVQFQQDSVRLNPGQSETLRLKAEEIGKGKHVLNVETQVTDDQQIIRGGPKLHQSIIHDAVGIKKVTFEEAFLSQRENCWEL